MIRGSWFIELNVIVFYDILKVLLKRMKSLKYALKMYKFLLYALKMQNKVLYTESGRS